MSLVLLMLILIETGYKSEVVPMRFTPSVDNWIFTAIKEKGTNAYLLA